MAQKQKIYLETSIITAYFDFKKQDAERETATRTFWHGNLTEYDAFISETVIAELVKDAEHAGQQTQLVKDIPSLAVTDEANALAHRYLASGVIRPTKLADALHLAIATLNSINFLASWNYRDLARPAQQRKITDYNESNRLYVPTIATPDEFLKNHDT